ncbi:EAL domain-containing protein [Rhodoferax sp.]|uniref:EAL domain-containing protein n=1 Tax=Rhodoferax sp. TaxID=50421 RepID=UPI00374CFCCB
MKSINFRWRSLKTRVTLFTLAIFLLSMWAQAFSTSKMLHADMERMLGEQQFATVSVMAEKVNEELERRLQGLKNVTQRVSPVLLGNPLALQVLLEEHVILQSLFNGGTYVTGTDGTAIASLPMSANRIGINYLERDYLAAALKEGKAIVGRPVISKPQGEPIIGMALPIHDTQGKVIGALAGVINLAQPNFLDKITARHYGAAGGYLLIAPQHNLFVTATDKSRLMQPLPAPGVNPMHDRYMQGFNGFGTAINSRGTEDLSAAQRIPVAGWFAVAVLPTAEAFAPINAMHQRMLLTTLLLTLLAGALTWWVLRRELLPLLTTARSLATQAETDQLPQPLSLTRQDETDQLIGSFNRLQQTLTIRELTLKESEEKHRLLVENSHDVIYTLTRAGEITFMSSAWTALLGQSISQVVGQTIFAFVHPEDVVVCTTFMQNVIATGQSQEGIELRLRHLDASWHWFHSNAVPLINETGKVIGLQGSAMDISVRKRAEEDTRIAATAFESQQGTVITNAEKVILRVNKAFTKINGYTMEEAVGQTPRLLKSGRHDAGFYDAMWASIARSGSWQGEIWNRRKSGEAYPAWLNINAVKNAAGLATHYVGFFSDITERKVSEEKIDRLAFYDALTGLPNRRLLIDRLQQALTATARYHCKGALLLIDLDHFKTLNDTLGHEQGDLLLQHAARRLCACLHESDTVARVGGDSFMVLMEDLNLSEQEVATQAKALGEKIRSTLSQPFLLGNATHHSTASIGIALFDGTQQVSTEEPLKQVELAMYHAKAAGRDTLRFFGPQMQAVATARATLESGLREALEKNQFTLHYQAQMMGGHQITGVEALVRWQDPRRGMVSPAEFIPLAEETGLILPLGQWVLETACTQLAQWASRAEMEHLTVAVNVSANQFQQSDFVEQVLAVLERTGANPNRLKLELTESMLVSNVEEVIAKMGALKECGVSFSLDDFGTGYSSLSYLKRLPLDQLKIDQGFVRDILIDANDAAIAKMVIALAESLGLSVIAEGVETEAQRDFLAGLNCNAYQGYLFSRPLPLMEFETFFQRP